MARPNPAPMMRSARLRKPPKAACGQTDSVRKTRERDPPRSVSRPALVCWPPPFDIASPRHADQALPNPGFLRLVFPGRSLLPRQPGGGIPSATRAIPGASPIPIARRPWRSFPARRFLARRSNRAGLLAGLPCRRRHCPAGSRTPTTDEDVAVRYPPGPMPAAWDSLPFRVRSLSYTLVAQAEMPRARLAEEPRAGGAAPPRSHRRRSTSAVWPGDGAASFGKHRIERGESAAPATWRSFASVRASPAAGSSRSSPAATAGRAPAGYAPATG